MNSISFLGTVLEQRTFLYTPIPDKGRKVVYALILCQNFDISDRFLVCLVKILPGGEGNVVAIRVFFNEGKARERFEKAREEVLG